MMEFISIPLVVGIICASLYGLFELILRRKERLAIIEKIDGKIDASSFEGRLGLPSYKGSKITFSALKLGSLLAGIGLGLLIAFFIHIGFKMSPVYYQGDYFVREMVSVLYGSLVLLGGGAGLIVAFIIELKMGKKAEDRA
ncbi:hypothetical protein JQM83_04750 [Parabacteroides distasonis]|nr:hypothetical protein [Parabacteroides distasonis]